MATSLAEGKLNAATDLDVAVIDEFRKESAILDTMIFEDAVNPAGGGATLTYGYRRQITQVSAAFRAINSEYTPTNVTTEHYTTELAPLGGSFEVDRVVARIGPAASGAVSLNLSNKIKATRTAFQDAVINGDTDVDANGFDGLDKALRGSSTEFRPSTITDWSDLDTSAATKNTALDALDEFLALLDGTPTVLVGNAKALARVRAIARRSGMYVVNPIEDLVGQNGRPITRQEYGGVVFADAGEKAGSNSLIIPIRTQSNVDITVTASSGNISFDINGETVTVAYNANAATLQTAVDAVLDGSTVTKSGSVFTIVWPASFVVTTDNGSGVTIAAAAGSAAPATGLTDLYAYRVALDGFHGVSTVGAPLVQTWLPDFSTAGAVKKGEVEMGPVSVALKATKAAAVFRNIKVQ